eukprot:scaffold4869_cov183-Amphora_coffeaeformis.AAC.10
MECIIKSQIMVAVETNDFRRLEGKPNLSPQSDEYYNPINAMMACQLTLEGFHNSNRKQPAAFYRQCVSGPNDECLIDTGLQKTQTQNTPAVRCLRDKLKGRKPKKRGDRGRENDYFLFHRVRCVIKEKGQSNAAMVKRVKEMLETAKTPTTSTKADALSWRWKKLFIEHTVPHTKLARLLKGVRESTKQNSGNTTSGKGKSKTKRELSVLNKSWEGIVAYHQPYDNKEYGLDNEEGNERYVVDNSTFDGIKTKFLTKTTHLRIVLVKNKNIGIQVKRTPNTKTRCFQLCRLVLADRTKRNI